MAGENGEGSLEDKWSKDSPATEELGGQGSKSGTEVCDIITVELPNFMYSIGDALGINSL
jgi:hypothetical protein